MEFWFQLSTMDVVLHIGKYSFLGCVQGVSILWGDGVEFWNFGVDDDNRRDRKYPVVDSGYS